MKVNPALEDCPDVDHAPGHRGHPFRYMVARAADVVLFVEGGIVDLLECTALVIVTNRFPEL